MASSTHSAEEAEWIIGRPCGAAYCLACFFEIVRDSLAEGHAFGRTGPSEKTTGRLFLEVDPNAPANQRIADLKLAPRNARGRVEFWSDFFFLKPLDPNRGNRHLLYDVNNRGNKLALYWGSWGISTAYPPVNPDHPAATLTMRPDRTQPAVEIPHARRAPAGGRAPAVGA